MSFLQRLSLRKQQAQVDDRAVYGQLVALEAGDRLAESQDAKLEDLMARLGISEADFQSHVAVVRKANERLATITRLKNSPAELAKAEQEAQKFEAKWNPIIAECDRLKNDLMGRRENLQRECDRKATEETLLDEMRRENLLAFGLPEPEPYVPVQKTVQQLQQEQRDLVEFSDAMRIQDGINRGYQIYLSSDQVAVLERLEAAGKIEKGITAKARELVRKEPEADAHRGELVEVNRL